MRIVQLIALKLFSAVIVRMVLKVLLHSTSWSNLETFKLKRELPRNANGCQAANVTKSPRFLCTAKFELLRITSKSLKQCRLISLVVGSKVENFLTWEQNFLIRNEEQKWWTEMDRNGSESMERFIRVFGQFLIMKSFHWKPHEKSPGLLHQLSKMHCPV